MQQSNHGWSDMPVTKDQAQMIASLAVACRPNRAPTWDHAGVVANVWKIRDRSLSEVVLAVIRAAADHETTSPGVIPANGSHWQEQLKPEKWQPETLDPAERCGVCGKARQRCESAPRFADDDHVFAPDFRKPIETNVPLTVQAIREQLTTQPTPATTDERPADE